VISAEDPHGHILEFLDRTIKDIPLEIGTLTPLFSNSPVTRVIYIRKTTNVLASRPSEPLQFTRINGAAEMCYSQ
jgi:hypothetical protein